MATLTQLVVELVWVALAALVAIHYGERLPEPVGQSLAPALLFAIVMVALNGAFGIYRRQDNLAPGTYALRFILAAVVGIPLAYVIGGLLPNGDAFQDRIILVATLALGGVLIVRHLIVLPLVSSLLPHRVLVLGTGPEARLVEASLAASSPPSLRLMGFCSLDKASEMSIASGRIIDFDGPLVETVKKLGIHEIIIAVRQQRGGVLPLRELLDCRLAGVRVTDLARFFERVHGQVPVESLKVSWLIYGDGYRQSWLRNFVKRAFDLVVSAILLTLALPTMVVAAVLVAFESGRPVIYRQSRVGLGGKPFTVLKFRSMAKDAEKSFTPAWAATNDARITKVGRLLRRYRIDELPQLINVLRGEMSFVGPRPERPEFVTMLTEQIPFYAVRHSVKPGLTGWAQVRYSYGASVEQAAKKLEYDLYYVKNHTLALDLVILLETIRVVMLGEGAR